MPVGQILGPKPLKTTRCFENMSVAVRRSSFRARPACNSIEMTYQCKRRPIEREGGAGDWAGAPLYTAVCTTLAPRKEGARPGGRGQSNKQNFSTAPEVERKTSETRGFEPHHPTTNKTSKLLRSCRAALHTPKVAFPKSNGQDATPVGTGRRVGLEPTPELSLRRGRGLVVVHGPSLCGRGCPESLGRAQRKPLRIPFAVSTPRYPPPAAAHAPPYPPTPRVTFRRVALSLRGPSCPFACCVRSMRSDDRCGRCCLWCCCRVSGAQ